ncbi:MAG: hypothetical protein IJ475_01245 [Bacilli bacterium]|nr:hypothetical protein [Bacilli bacterium]
MKAVLIKIWNTIKNAFKLLLIAIVKIIVSLFPDRNKKTENKNNSNNINTTIENKKIIKSSSDTSTLPDTDNIKTNPDTNPHKEKEKKLFNILKKENNKKQKQFIIYKYNNETLDKIIDSILEDELKLKIKEVSKETKEYLKEYKEDLIYVIHNKIEHIEISSDEELHLTVKPIVLDKLKEEPLKLKENEAKNDLAQDIYFIVTPIKKELDINKEPVLNPTIILEDISNNKIDEINKFIDKYPYTQVSTTKETPKLHLKNEVTNIVLGSTLVLASIAKDLISKPEEKIDEENIIQEINPPLVTEENLEKNITNTNENTIIPEEISIIENKNEEIKIDEQITKESPLEKEEQQEIKKQKKELETKKEELAKLKKEIDEYEAKRKNDTTNIEKDSINEIKKEDYEDKNYEELEHQINKALYEIEMFLIKHEGKITPEQRKKLEQEKERLYNLKNKLHIEEQKDLKNEEIALKEQITSKEINSLKNELENIKIKNQFDLTEHLLNNVEDLNNIEAKKAKNIEKLLLKKKLRRTSKAATIASILALPFIHNKFFFFLSTGLFVNHNLRYATSVLNRQTANIAEPNLDEISRGSDALEASIDTTYENLMLIDNLKQQAISKHPELQYDPEYLTYVNKISNKLNQSYTRLNKKQKTMEKLLGRSKKAQKRLQLQKQKMINN